MKHPENKSPTEEPDWSYSLKVLDLTLRWDGKHMSNSATKLFAYAHELGVAKKDAIKWFSTADNVILSKKGIEMVKKWANAGYKMRTVPIDELDGVADQLIAAGTHRDPHHVKEAWLRFIAAGKTDLQAVLFRLVLREDNTHRTAQRGMRGEINIKDELRGLEHAAWLLDYKAAIMTVYVALSPFPEVVQRAKQFLDGYDSLMDPVKEELKQLRKQREAGGTQGN